MGSQSWNGGSEEVKETFLLAHFSPVSVHGQVQSVLTSLGFLKHGGFGLGLLGGECLSRPEVPKVKLFDCYHWQQ